MVAVTTACLSVMFISSCHKVEQESPRKLPHRGFESWVYGYPIRPNGRDPASINAAPAPNAEGTAAPIDQLAKMPHYVSPDLKVVVRISLNSLWTTGWMDLGQEPVVFSVPDTNDR
jgi:hypothetical protein